jgi:hypothetical protein
MGLSSARVGFDDVRFGHAVQEVLKNLQPVDAAELLVRIRMVKSADELALMRRAAKINQGAIEAIGMKLSRKRQCRCKEVEDLTQGWVDDLPPQSRSLVQVCLRRGGHPSALSVLFGPSL